MRMQTGISKGFTLIELMVTVAIIGILAAVVVPNYMESVRRGHRNDGMDALTAAAYKMEVYRGQNGTYPNNDQKDLANIGDTSAKEYYGDLTILDDADIPEDCPLTSCYVLQISGQNGQEESSVIRYRLYSTGQKKRLPYGGSSEDDWVDGWK